MSIALNNREVTRQDLKPRACEACMPCEAEASADHGRWLAFVSPDLAAEVELAMEPDQHPAARPFKMALLHEEMPFIPFGAAKSQAEYQRLQEAGVLLSQPVCYQGPLVMTVVYDTSGNLLQITQKQ